MPPAAMPRNGADFPLRGSNMTYDLPAFLLGAQHFIVAFGTSLILLALFKWLYQMATPYDERALIAGGNRAAATALGGSVIGFTLPLASALAVTADVVEFVMWAVLAGIIQIVAFVVIRRFIISDVRGQIESGNMAVAAYLAATAIAVGLLNAASMTY